MRAVVLAGGQGTRLRPYTTLIPKPLVPIGNQMPILEVIIKQLKANGFDHITISVNHLSHLIMAFFGDGTRWNIKIDYSIEDKPLSTIGPLTLINDLPEDFLVMNGDVLSDVNYHSLMQYHIHNRNEVTVSTFKRESKIDFGVIGCTDDGQIQSFTEKPTYHFEVSMGIYCLNRNVVSRLTHGAKYGFDDLMIDGLSNKYRYIAKEFKGFWLDIGRPDDYDYCNENFEDLRLKLGI